MTEQEIREKLADIILEIRAYLCNTEFAPEPFTEPVDAEILRVKYPSQILAIFKEAGYVQLAKLTREQRYTIWKDVEAGGK